jgi:hypothetical protein
MHPDRNHKLSHKIHITQHLMWFTQLWATTTMVAFFIVPFLSVPSLRTTLT